MWGPLEGAPRPALLHPFLHLPSHPCKAESLNSESHPDSRGITPPDESPAAIQKVSEDRCAVSFLYVHVGFQCVYAQPGQGTTADAQTGEMWPNLKLGPTCLHRKTEIKANLDSRRNSLQLQMWWDFFSFFTRKISTAGPKRKMMNEARTLPAPLFSS